jgi:hypothetical protein
VNAGIGATDSDYGSLRAQRDVLSKNPDLVIIEFAVNDIGGDTTLDDTYEGLCEAATGRALSSRRNLAFHDDLSAIDFPIESRAIFYGSTMAVCHRCSLQPSHG